MKKRTKKAVIVGFGIVATALGITKIVSGKAPAKFSIKWFDSLSEADLNDEREIVRKAYCLSGNDYNLAVHLQNLLGLFDKELSKRASGDCTDYGFPVHSGDGWYLQTKN